VAEQVAEQVGEPAAALRVAAPGQVRARAQAQVQVQVLERVPEPEPEQVQAPVRLVVLRPAVARRLPVRRAVPSGSRS
jgi:hypothetical protein